MSIWAAIVAVLKALAVAFGMKQRADAKADGAAIQRDQDLRAENAKVAEADRARDDVRSGGGVPVEADPWNRDNR